MSKELEIKESFDLSGTKKGKITISKIDEPYGKDSHSVASIGITLTGDIDNPEWKVHIPLENVDQVVSALSKIK